MSRKLQERPLLLAICLLLMFTTLVSGAAIAQTTPTVLHNFGSYSGDALQPVPFAALTQGRDGAMYGTTQYGGANGNGAVFRIDATATKRSCTASPAHPEPTTA